MTLVKKFDFNIGKILQNWEAKDAIREIIANALDEQKLTDSNPPIIYFHNSNQLTIQDFGRGLENKHLTQNENPEKYENSHLIGVFGIGLKDALATLTRYKVAIKIESPFLSINKIKLEPKNDFSEIQTLHAFINNQSNTMKGTKFELTGITPSAVIQAKNYFLQFRNLTVLQENKYGQIIAKANHSDHASIFINGLEVNTEPNFLFHYNITNKDQKIRQALNRERMNVGRSAYAGRIKKIITNCDSSSINDQLREQFYQRESGTTCEEISWIEVQKHLFRNIDSEQVVMVTQQQLINDHQKVDLARRDGKEVMVVPDRLYQSMPDVSLDNFTRTQYQNFEYDWVPINQLDSAEQQIFSQANLIMEIWDRYESWMQAITIKISENMPGVGTLGEWKANEKTIIIKRSQLANLQSYAGTLIHELIHAVTNLNDIDRDFELALTKTIGYLVVKIIRQKNLS